MLRKIGILCAAILLCGTAISAQRGHHRPAPLSDELKAELNLTAEQDAALEKLRADTEARLTQLRESNDLDHDARRAAAREIFKEAKAARLDILTETQQAQLRDYHQAQREARRERMAEVDHEALRRELRAYRETEIKPVMDAQRARLETELSAEDRTRLDEIRATLEAERAARKQERKDHAEPRDRSEKKDHHRPARHAHHEQGRKLHRLREHQPELFAELNAMAEHYDGVITPLLEELEPRHEEWRAGQRTIMEGYLPENMPKHHRSDRHDRKLEERHATARKIGFLLRAADAGVPTEPATAPLERIVTRAYPNPAVNATTLAFELPAPLALTVTVRDENGGILKTVTRETFAAGAHALSVDLSDLTNGTYYLTLSGDRLTSPQATKVVIVR